MMAIVAQHLKPMKHWKSEDLDAIVTEGDRHHVSRLVYLGWPSNRDDTMLDIDEITSVMNCRLWGTNTSVSLGFTE